MPLKSINPTQTKSWSELQYHFQEIKNTHIKELFKKDANRFEKFSIQWNDLLLDFSKNKIDQNTLKHLFNLCDEVGLNDAIEKMFIGDLINDTEKKAVLHTALRNRSNTPIYINGEDVMPKVNSVLSQMKCFTDKVISKNWKGYTGKPITDVVNIGIGGSDLGPLMVCETLKKYKTRLQTHFVSNIDASHIINVLDKINPETTLFIIASKTFTTKETMTNAHTSRKWFLNVAKEQDITKHFVAISTNKKSIIDFGIDPKNMFEFWDWVGGRYSLWSSIGLSISLSIGFHNFEKLLEGAHQMDKHFRGTHKEKNIPIILALIGIWYNNFFETETEAVLPYNQYLNQFVSYLQQTYMESNGKFVDRNSKKINYQTSGVLWGQVGTNGQHSFYQLLHQGTKIVPIDFLIAAQCLHNKNDHHFELLSNFFAQSRALMFGKNENDVLEELQKEGKTKEEIDRLKVFKIFEGDRPSNSILFKKLTPKTLGNLIAMYEHKIFVQGVIWNIFSFDQWGVELGKQLAVEIRSKVENNDKVTQYDASTNGLINAYKKMR